MLTIWWKYQISTKKYKCININYHELALIINKKFAMLAPKAKKIQAKDPVQARIFLLNIGLSVNVRPADG